MLASKDTIRPHIYRHALQVGNTAKLLWMGNLAWTGDGESLKEMDHFWSKCASIVLSNPN